MHIESPIRAASPQRAPLVLRVGFWTCLVIAVAVVIRRLWALAYPPASSPPQLAALDQIFASHAVLTVSHILPALAFVLLIPVVLFRPAYRLRWTEPTLFALGGIVGVTAYAMSVYSVGGWVERSAVLVFNSLFLFSLFRAFRERDHIPQKRRWLIRAIVILLGIATTRPVMGVFFATSRLTHLQPNQFFGWAFWIGFSINTAVGELWLHRRRTV